MVLRLGLMIAGIALVIASCSGDDDSGGFSSLVEDAGQESSTGSSDIDVCSLLSASELSAVLGEPRTPKESEPAGPFTGCSWGTGDVIVSVAKTGSIILAPGEDECPSAGLGEESYACEGRVKFLTNGTHVSVTTVDPFMPDDLLVALAETVFENLSS